MATTPELRDGVPLQVHLAFAGPGAYAVSWATHPLDGLRLLGEGEAAAAAGGLGAASRRLAAAGAALEQQQEPHVGSAAAGDEEEADASEQLGRRHHRRHRRKHRTCEAVRKAAGRSVVQYGTEPGEYPHTGEGCCACLVLLLACLVLAAAAGWHEGLAMHLLMLVFLSVAVNLQRAS